MALTEARALAGDLLSKPWDAETIARAALEVTTALLEASPRVTWDGVQADREIARSAGRAGIWWADAAGLGDERRLARKLQKLATTAGFGTARVGIADAAITAYAATCRSPVAGPPRLTSVIPSGRDVEFLAPFPITLLQLDEDLVDTFAALGLTTLGQLAALGTDEVESRFGPEGLAAHRLARGLDQRGPSTPRDGDLPTIECDLGGPVATSEPLLFVLRGALASLGTVLRTQGLAAQELTLGLSLDDGSRVERAIRPARPSSHETALFDHVRAALDEWRLNSPVVALQLSAALTVPASGEQGDLLVPRWADPVALEAAFDRIRGKEGGDAVVVPIARNGHMLSDGGAWESRNGAATRYGSRTVRERETTLGLATRHSPLALPPYCPAALRLLTGPVPIRVRLDRGGIEAFHHGTTWHDVTAWAGPERLAPRWWQSGESARDYYIIRDRDNALWIVYRRVWQRDWFLEGWWD